MVATSLGNVSGSIPSCLAFGETLFISGFVFLILGVVVTPVGRALLLMEADCVVAAGVVVSVVVSVCSSVESLLVGLDAWCLCWILVSEKVASSSSDESAFVLVPGPVVRLAFFLVGAMSNVKFMTVEQV